MERKGTEPTFMDGFVADLGDPKMAARLDQLDRTIPWHKLAAPIRATYDNDGEQGGRPNVAVVVMLKIVMLQKWFSLSDEAMEGMLLDRISFRRFVGLSMNDGTVDATTLVKFRNRLREHGLMSVLFDMVVTHLRDAGLIVQEGTLVDATIIEASKGAPTTTAWATPKIRRRPTQTPTAKHITDTMGTSPRTPTASSPTMSTTRPRFTIRNTSSS